MGWSGEVKGLPHVRGKAADGHKCINENVVMYSGLVLE